jgi:hypothetical protein
MEQDMAETYIYQGRRFGVAYARLAANIALVWGRVDRVDRTATRTLRLGLCNLDSATRARLLLRLNRIASILSKRCLEIKSASKEYN